MKNESTIAANQASTKSIMTATQTNEKSNMPTPQIGIKSTMSSIQTKTDSNTISAQAKAKHDTSIKPEISNTYPLSQYFPLIRARQEIYQSIYQNPALYELFSTWDPKYQEDFLDQCSGKKGMNVLYDGIFKELFNPEATPERLSQLLSLLLGREVSVKTVLPNDSVRLGSESSLLYTDIIVELEDRSLANIEIQKIGYAFPGQRCACYSADHLLRQYKRVRGESGKQFNYQDIKRVYTIVFFETSPGVFHDFPRDWLHMFHQQSDTGLALELLQEYLFIPLDIFRKSMENKPIRTFLEAWLAFLSFTSPERIEELITSYPPFKAMYQEIYELCLNTEKVMNVYSKELEILDRNTVLYMIDEMQEQIERKDLALEKNAQAMKQKDLALEKNAQAMKQKDLALEKNAQAMKQKDQALVQKEQEILELKSRLAALQNAKR